MMYLSGVIPTSDLKSSTKQVTTVPSLCAYNNQTMKYIVN